MHDGGGAFQRSRRRRHCGLRTAHIARVNEHGPNTGEAAPTVKVDAAAKDSAALADKLGV